MNTTLKEVLDLLLAERETTVQLRQKINKYAVARGTMRLLASRLGWKAVKNGPSASGFLTERVGMLKREAASLSLLACGMETTDPLQAMVAAQDRIRALEGLVEKYREKFPTN